MGQSQQNTQSTVINLQVLYLNATKGDGRDKRAAPALSCTHERGTIFGEMAEKLDCAYAPDVSSSGTIRSA